MTIFPDDDKKRKKDYPEPEPNPPHAFQGGTIRGADGIRIDVVDGQIKLDGKTVGRYKRPAGGFNRGCGIIFIIVVVAATVLPIFFFVIAPMFGLFNPFGEDTREVPGDAAAFDPIASYAEIAAYAQDEAAEVEFVEMSAYYVKSDGTLDLTVTTYHPNVSWEFVVPAPRPENAPPVGAGGSPDDRYFQTVTIRAYEPGQMRSVSRTSGGVRTSYTYRHLGLERDVDDPSTSRDTATPPPTCSFKTLWDTAAERGAPREAVAIITYRQGKYDFWIQDTDVRLEFNAQCREI